MFTKHCLALLLAIDGVWWQKAKEDSSKMVDIEKEKVNKCLRRFSEGILLSFCQQAEEIS